MTPGKAHLFWNGTFSDEEKERLFRYADASPLAEVLRDLRPGRDLGRFLEFDQRYYLADDILYKVDRISMAHSLEVRPPFLDDRIVDFANRLPDDFKLRGRIEICVAAPNGEEAAAFCAASSKSALTYRFTNGSAAFCGRYWSAR